MRAKIVLLMHIHQEPSASAFLGAMLIWTGASALAAGLLARASLAPIGHWWWVPVEFAGYTVATVTLAIGVWLRELAMPVVQEHLRRARLRPRRNTPAGVIEPRHYR